MALAPADAPDTVARIHEGMPVVDILAHQLRRQLGVELDDLRSAGREGLVHAARSFDPSLGVPFRRWANLRVRGAMIDAVRSQSNLPRRVHARLRAIEAGDRVSEAAAEENAHKPGPKTPAEADTHLDNYLAGLATAMAVGLVAEAVGPDADDVRDAAVGADEQLAQHEVMKLVRSAVEKQPEAERHLITRHYFDGVTFDEAAKELGLSKSWASRLHTRAIEGIARELKRNRVTA